MELKGQSENFYSNRLLWKAFWLPIFLTLTFLFVFFTERGGRVAFIFTIFYPSIVFYIIKEILTSERLSSFFNYSTIGKAFIMSGCCLFFISFIPSILKIQLEIILKIFVVLYVLSWISLFIGLIIFPPTKNFILHNSVIGKISLIVSSIFLLLFLFKRAIALNNAVAIYPQVVIILIILYVLSWCIVFIGLLNREFKEKLLAFISLNSLILSGIGLNLFLLLFYSNRYFIAMIFLIPITLLQLITILKGTLLSQRS